MPPFLHFYSGLTPADFRDLSLSDYTALNNYRIEWLKAQEQAHVSGS